MNSSKQLIREVLDAFCGGEIPAAAVNGKAADRRGEIPATAVNGKAADRRGEIPAAGGVPASAIADVWQRGDKFAHGALPAAIADTHLVNVKSHVRGGPGPGEKGGKAPLTLAELVREYSADQRQTAQRAVRLGRLSDEWIRAAGTARSAAPRSGQRGEVHLPGTA